MQIEKQDERLAESKLSPALWKSVPISPQNAPPYRAWEFQMIHRNFYPWHSSEEMFTTSLGSVEFAKEVRRPSTGEHIKPIVRSEMASSIRGPQSICGALSKAASPRYVCHNCRQNLLRPNRQPIRAASTLLSSNRIYRSQNSTELQAHPTATYATKSVEDYIYRKQPVDSLQGFEGEDAEYEEASTWAGIETLGQENPLGDVNKSTDKFKP